MLSWVLNGDGVVGTGEAPSMTVVMAFNDLFMGAFVLLVKLGRTGYRTDGVGGFRLQGCSYAGAGIGAGNIPAGAGKCG